MNQIWIGLAALALMMPVASGAAHHEPSPGSADSGVSAGDASLSGVVTETMDASRYTYVLLDTGSATVWVAANQTAVKVGDQVEVSGAMPMDQFYSRSLDRTFERIYFGSSIRPAGSGGAAGALPPGHPEIDGYGVPAADSTYELPPGHPEIPGAAAPAVAAPSETLEPVAGGTTIAEVFAGKDELAGGEVAVRGTVVKVNNGILGRNWIHLSDGTGGAGTDDLTVTSVSHTAQPGDTVVARGTVGLDRDFGGGYFYPVLVEDAVLTVE